ncbi:MAG: family N-acetyltransferase [Sphingomonas bacterium]|uniref:GNAT family N-acetyltransferase n=1 Tax=Sphingomonas bacterium TaxID=1895847 RepID=UPI002631F70E|nr:N-acetyltransferase [Sphingomonas bacterium]MDB5707669.1 family N-acetyltransferase [Sphingomonas bacterium]
MIRIAPIAAVEPQAVEQLLDHAFGTDRHERTAYRIREGMPAIPRLSFAALAGDALVGTIQCWPILFCGDDGRDMPMVMVGPVAVEPARQRDGIGRDLMLYALNAAVAAGEAGALMLIGDPEYYGRFFGFSADRTAGWRVPGPVDSRRLLALGDSVPASAGMLGPRIVALA